MSSVEKDPLIGGLDRTTMATALPTSPKAETAVSRTPSVRNSNMVLSSDTSWTERSERKSSSCGRREGSGRQTMVQVAVPKVTNWK